MPALAPLSAPVLSGQERDFSFLPEKVAVYGPVREQAISREQAIQFLKEKFTSDHLTVMSEGEIRSAVRILAANRFERAIMDRILKENGITPNPDEMSKELRHLHHSLPLPQRQSIEKQLLADGSNFETYLKKSVNDPDSVIRYAFIQWVERSSADKITVNDADVEHFYRMNQGLFLIPETLVLSQITVPAQSDAEAVRTRLALGEKFASLMPVYNGGKYGEFVRHELDKEIRQAVDSLNVGESSIPLRRKEGWVIFHVDNRVRAQFVPLADVKDYIRREIRKVRMLGEVQRIMNSECRKLNFELTL